jgi:hypothetical protein
MGQNAILTCGPCGTTQSLKHLDISRSKCVTRSQKGCQMLDITNQNQTFIYLLPFETIVIMAS